MLQGKLKKMFLTCVNFCFLTSSGQPLSPQTKQSLLGHSPDDEQKVDYCSTKSASAGLSSKGFSQAAPASAEPIPNAFSDLTK